MKEMKMPIVNFEQYELITQVAETIDPNENLTPQIKKMLKTNSSLQEIIDRSFSGSVDALASFIDENSQRTSLIVGSVYVNCNADIEIDCPDPLSEEDDLEEYIRDKLDLSYAHMFSDVSIDSSSLDIEERIEMRPYEEVAQLV